MVAGMGFAGFGRVKIALMTVTARQMRVVRGSDRVFRREKPFCFAVMTRGFFVMVRGVVMMARSGMVTGHDRLQAE